MEDKVKIKVAGAGAGKTTSLAEEVYYSYQNNSKNIYCLSYTNASVETIEERLRKKFDGEIPERIIVSTIHKFLYQELIKPYNFFLYQIDFDRIVNIKFDNLKYRNSKIKQLKDNKILHVEEIPQVARYILLDKSADRKKTKLIREKLKELICSYIGVIFVDECQDIDKHVKEILTEFSLLDIEVNLVGDPKQDISGLNVFSGLLNDIDSIENRIEYINLNYRCPKEHIEFFNQFVPDEQKQFSPIEKSGELSFVFQDEVTEINKFIKEFELVYIYQKRGIFETQPNKKFENTFTELIQILRNKKVKETEIIMRSSKIAAYFIYSVNNGKAINKTIQSIFRYGSIDSKEYKTLESAIIMDVKSIDNGSEKNSILVNSIHNVKGLEEEKCLFIITNAMMPYLLREKVNLKMNSILYVGLSRSLSNLCLFFHEETVERYGRDIINNLMKDYATV